MHEREENHMIRYVKWTSVLSLGLLLALPAAAQAGLGDLAILGEGVAQRSSSSDPFWETGNGDARTIAPGETLVIADLEGPGVINHIWNTVASSEPGYSNLLLVRMYWDGEEHPSVEAPLGAFFGIGHGMDVPFSSIPVAVSSDGRARNCYWPMPFKKAARITVTNEGKEGVNAFYYYVDWTKLDTLPKDSAYFHAYYRQEYPAAPDKRFLIADIEGRGHYVGTSQHVRQRLSSWLGEGDDFFFIDGEEEPSLRGTGTEDYYCDAWGFRKLAYPYYGVPLFEGYEAGNRTSVYRWHVADPIRFKDSLRVEIEHVGPVLQPNGRVEGYGARPDDVATVAYWYQTEPHKPWEPIPSGYDRMYPADFLSGLAGTPYMDLWVKTLLSHGMIGAARAEEVADGAALSVTNPLPSAVTMELAFEPYRGVQITATESTLELAPGGTGQTSFSVTGLDGVSVEQVSVVPFTGVIRLPAIDSALPFHGSVIVDAPFRPAGPGEAPIVDGDLSDWPGLRFGISVPAQIIDQEGGWNGPEDCSWAMDVATASDMLYVAIDVTDDDVVRNENVEPWLQDGVEIRLAAMPGEDQAKWRGQSDLEKTLLIAVAPETPDLDQSVWKKDQLPDGVQVASLKTSRGYVIEAAIPFSYLDEQQGQAWQNFRFNVAVDDRDGNKAVTQLWWRPDWRSEAAFDGSGTFVRP
jgi:hypothetical protein